MVSKLTGFQDSEPVVASVGSAQRPGPVLFAAVFPEFIAREKPGQAPRATVAGKSDELGERRTAANGPGGALKPTPRGERPCVPAARLAGWLLVDQVQPVRCMRGAPSKARRGWAVQPIPWRASAARRPGAKRRPEASGIKAAWPRLGTRRGATPASPTAARRDALLFTTKCK